MRLLVPCVKRPSATSSLVQRDDGLADSLPSRAVNWNRGWEAGLTDRAISAKSAERGDGLHPPRFDSRTGYIGASAGLGLDKAGVSPAFTICFNSLAALK
jgi:hypothetical protein